MASQYNWIGFYTEFATKLLSFRSNRTELIRKIQHVYETIEIKLPKLENSIVPVDIDPFTVYGLFNKGITDENRIRIIEGFKDEFSVSAAVPSDFGGIPVVDNRAATFYYFDDQRGPYDIDNIWDVFVAALKLSDSDTAGTRTAFSTAYDKTLTQKGIRWNLSMGLFWIRPFRFINLDSRNRWYFENGSGLPEDFVHQIDDNHVPSGNEYLQICDRLLSEFQKPGSNFGNFIELSSEAWKVSQKENDRIEAEKNKKQKSTDGSTHHYWLYSPGDDAKYWDYCFNNGLMVHSCDELGDLNQYKTKEDMVKYLVQTEEYAEKSPDKEALTAWQFYKTMNPGDIVFVKKGRKTIVGRGIVESDYNYDFSRPEYRNVRKAKWTHKGFWEYPLETMAPMRALSEISGDAEKIQKFEALFSENDKPHVTTPLKMETDETETKTKYEKDDFLSDVFIDEEQYNKLVSIIRKKQNIILQGAPGVGKTFAARRLAWSMMGMRDDSRIEFVQFHQNYSYEDFVMGFRPNENGSFDLRPGVFFKFCNKAANDPERDYFFIIDEINRGNLSKIFGELLMLIEKDYRNNPITLAYDEKLFSVPGNLYIIGMMNTADRSLAMMDYALRRRFCFFKMKPAFSNPRFKEFLIDKKGISKEFANEICKRMTILNDQIADEKVSGLGEGFCVGHSYFCSTPDESQNEKDWFNTIVDFEVAPLLEEYWWDEPDKAENAIGSLKI